MKVDVISMDKKSERKILNTVFNKNKFIKVIESECPDFIILDNIEDEIIGVEITEFHIHQASALLKKRASAYEDYIDSGIERIKGMIEYSFPTTMVIDGSKIKGMLYRPVTYSERINKLCQCVNSKSQKAINYKTSKTALIISDVDNLLLKMFYKSTNFPAIILNNELFDTILKSPFHEIYVSSPNSEHEYFSIKSNVLVCLARLVYTMLHKSDIETHRFFIGTFVEVLHKIKLPVLCPIINEQNEVCFSYGNSMIVCSKTIYVAQNTIPLKLVATNTGYQYEFSDSTVESVLKLIDYSKSLLDGAEQIDLKHPYNEIIRKGFSPDQKLTLRIINKD